MKTILPILLITLLCGCAAHREDIRNNLLKTGQPQSAFRKEWGYPTKTYTKTGESKGFEGRVGPVGGWFAMNPKRTYDLWFYEKKAVTLVFHDEELVGWNWSATPPE